MEKPTLENPTQLNKDIQRTDLPKRKIKYRFIMPIHSILSPTPHLWKRLRRRERKRNGSGKTECSRYTGEIIKDNIDYDILKQDMKFDGDRLDEIVDLMLEWYVTARKRVRIAGDDAAELVKSKFMKLDASISALCLTVCENTTKTGNIKQYLKAALFNAPSTIGNYYTSLCRP